MSTPNTNHLAVTADGALLAAVGDAGVVYVWDLATRTLLARHDGHPDVYRLAFVPEAATGTGAGAGAGASTRRLASTGWDGIVVWDAVTGAEVASPLPDEPVHAMAYSRDGRLLAAGSSDGPVFVVDVGSGAEVRRLERHTEPVFGTAFLPGDRRLVTMALDGPLLMWDVFDGRVLREWPEKKSQYGMDLAPNGRHVVYVTGEAVRLLAVETVETVETVDALREYPLSGWTRAAFSADGERFVVAGDTMTVWGTWYGTEHGTVDGYPGGVEAVVAVPGTSLVATGHKGDATVRLWDVDTGTAAGELSVAPG